MNAVPKVMHINCACTGSTGRIISDIADHAKGKGYETLLCAPGTPGENQNIRYFRTSLPYEQGIYRRLNRLYGFQYGFAPLSTLRIKKLIKKEKPDLVHIHCVNGFMVNVYKLLQLVKKQGIPAVITNHAEFFYTGSCAHAFDCEKWLTGCGQCPRLRQATCGAHRDTTAAAWRKMKDAFADFHNGMMVSVSPWVGSRAARSPITAELPQAVVKNGVHTGIFTYADPLELRKKYGFPQNTKIIFHPTAHFSAAEEDPKGGRYILELARMMSGQDVLFLVAGDHPAAMEVPENLHLLGKISDRQVLAQYYALADLTVVTGKRETFNMPVAESLCCGTPVAGFLAGGPESIAMEAFSRFCPQGDTQALAACVSELLSRKTDRPALAEQAKKVYDSQVMAEQYLTIYERLLMNGSK